jgi:chitin disaccharide deacetylase
MSTRLIVNADDYGHTPGVSAGIRKAHVDGIVTAATVMMNHADASPAITQAREECPRLALGVHLIMTEGASILPAGRVPSLVGPGGSFHGLRDLMAGAVRYDIGELRNEWRAQIECFLASGAVIDHLDSHHHAAYVADDLLGLLYDLAEEYAVPIRHPYSAHVMFGGEDGATLEKLAWARAYADPLLASGRARTTGTVDCRFYDRGVTVETLLAMLDDLPRDCTAEIMAHPGFADDELMRTSSYNTMREVELGILTDARVRDRVQQLGIELIAFRDL